MLGFVGDVGDLAKLVQGKAGVRPTLDLDTKLGPRTGGLSLGRTHPRRLLRRRSRSCLRLNNG